MNVYSLFQCSEKGIVKINRHKNVWPLLMLASQQTHNIRIPFVQWRPNVVDVGPILYKCFTNVLVLLGSLLYFGVNMVNKGVFVYKGRTIRYLGGGEGGLEFLLLANFFLPPRENNFFFWQSTSDKFFFMFRRIIFLSYAFPIMCFIIFSSQHIFRKFPQQTFFFSPHF